MVCQVLAPPTTIGSEPGGLRFCSSPPKSSVRHCVHVTPEVNQTHLRRPRPIHLWSLALWENISSGQGSLGVREWKKGAHMFADIGPRRPQSWRTVSYRRVAVNAARSETMCREQLRWCWSWPRRGQSFVSAGFDIMLNSPVFPDNNLGCQVCQ